MRLLIQRVKNASVSVGGDELSRIGQGLLVLVGVGVEDTDEDMEYLAGKLVRLRIFDDEQGVMNLDVRQVGGEELLGREVPTGEFGADMQVALVNDGPVTIWIDSKMRDC